MDAKFTTEAASAAAFDQLIEQTGMFRTFREVPGTLLQPRLGQTDKGMRIDRVLVPNDRLILAGWRNGIIGVEIKKDADSTLGPAIAQAMDYTRSAFSLPNGFCVVPAYVFLWPMPKQHGPMASVLAQNRLGSIQSGNWGVRMQFNSGEGSILRLYTDGHVEVGACKAGAKAGSR